MSPTLPSETSLGAARTNTETWVRGSLILASAIAALAAVCHLSVMLWAQHEFAQPESVVAAQSMMLAHGGGLYHSLRDYPYTVNAYMPIFYGLEAALIQLGLPAFTAGRLISFAALAGILALVWRLVLLYTNERYCAWIGIVLGGSASLLWSWGTVAQVDTLAVFFSLAGFYEYSRYALRNENTLLLAAGCVILAVFTKQTAVACPAAIFVLLWFGNRKAALQFGAMVAGPVIVLVLAINAALNGRFLENTVFANLNPFAWEKFGQHVHYFAIASGQLVIVAAVGLATAFKRTPKAPFVYLGFALSILGLTAPKIGSDSNYQIESTLLLILCASVVLHTVDFFPLVLRGSKSWVTLLQIPLAIHLLLNFRITAPFLIARVVKERQFRQEVAALRPQLAGRGRVLSTDIDAMVHLRGRLEVEPLIYTLLVNAGRIDPHPVERDIAHGAFSTIVLYQDVNRPPDSDPEFPTLPAAQLDQIRRSYQLVQHIPGPSLDGLFVYKPLSLLPQAAEDNR